MKAEPDMRPLSRQEVELVRSIARDVMKPSGGVDGLRLKIRFGEALTPEVVVQLCDEIDSLKAEAARNNKLAMDLVDRVREFFHAMPPEFRARAAVSAAYIEVLTFMDAGVFVRASTPPTVVEALRNVFRTHLLIQPEVGK